MAPELELFGVPLNADSLTIAVDRITASISTGKQCVAFFANVHTVETAQRDQRLLDAFVRADFVFADGAPLAWAARFLRRGRCPRIAGWDVFTHVNERAAGAGASVFLLGGTETTLDALVEQLPIRFRDLRIVGTASPPFREPTAEEHLALIDEINSASPDVLWVGLGAPKQELWIIENREHLDARFIAGVGAVFEFASGQRRRAPVALQRVGLEWAFRLAQEPGRLWKRYAVTNSTFLIRLLVEGAKSVHQERRRGVSRA